MSMSNISKLEYGLNNSYENLEYDFLFPFKVDDAIKTWHISCLEIFIIMMRLKIRYNFGKEFHNIH